MWLIPLARSGGHDGHGFHDCRWCLILVLVVVLVVFAECTTSNATSRATATDRISEKPRARSRRKRNWRWRLVSVYGGRRRGPVQKLNVLVELQWVIRHGGRGRYGCCGGGGCHGCGGGGTFDAAYERVDQKRSGHGLLGGGHGDGPTRVVHRDRAAGTYNWRSRRGDFNKRPTDETVQII